MWYDEWMITSLRGNILHKGEKFSVIETGGVGYKVFLSPAALAHAGKLGDEVFVWTYQSVREDALDLYGFADITELSFFEMLLSVSGIGPKSALGILGVATIETLRKAIATGDTSYLTKISGIGRKTAEKIVIELRDKMDKEEQDGGVSLKGEMDALEALKSLGYSQTEARDALKEVSAEDTNAKIREALKILGNK